jgi:hypothetical protein
MLPLDIANRALQHVRFPHISSFAEGSAPAYETAFVYDKLRRAELRRNAWRFAIKRVTLRALDYASVVLTPSTYAAGTTYPTGAIVQYPANSGAYWISLKDSNTGNTPGVPTAYGVLSWDQYFGPLTMDPFNWAGGSAAPTIPLSYNVGELVFTTPGDGTYTIYRAQRAGSALDTTPTPSAVDTWEDNILYSSGDVVSYNGTNYQSRVNFNVNNVPPTSATQWTSTVTNPAVSGSFQTIAATIAPFKLLYPVTAGPLSDASTRNALRLPAGYLKEAPQDPKGAAVSFLGGSSGLPYNDWEYEGNFLVTRSTIINYRFVADIQDVTAMDDMFCEGLALRMAMEVAPALKADVSSRTLRADYKDVMGEARTINGIETGWEDPPEDEWLSVRR